MGVVRGGGSRPAAHEPENEMRQPMRDARRPTRHGFTLVELIIVVAMIGVLAGLLAPGLAKALEIADQTTCASNLRQLGVAMSVYLKDNDGLFFPIREPNDPETPEEESKLWYFGYETGTGWPQTAEGKRVLDKTRAKLYPYTDAYAGIEICPAFYHSGSYKAKFRGKWWTYGINKVLSPDRFVNPGKRCRSILEIRGSDTSRTVVMADAAQVNTFQAPASRSNPLLEEWHYVQPEDRSLPDWPHVHFRHGGLANVLFADWHVEACPPREGSYDGRLPSVRVGCLDEEEVLFRPRRCP